MVLANSDIISGHTSLLNIVIPRHSFWVFTASHIYCKIEDIGDSFYKFSKSFKLYNIIIIITFAILSACKCCVESCTEASQ